MPLSATGQFVERVLVAAESGPWNPLELRDAGDYALRELSCEVRRRPSAFHLKEMLLPLNECLIAVEADQRGAAHRAAYRLLLHLRREPRPTVAPAAAPPLFPRKPQP